MKTGGSCADSCVGKIICFGGDGPRKTGWLSLPGGRPIVLRNLTFFFEDRREDDSAAHKAMVVFQHNITGGRKIFVDETSLRESVKRYLETHPDLVGDVTKVLDQVGVKGGNARKITATSVSEAIQEFEQQHELSHVSSLLRYELKDSINDIKKFLSWGCRKVIPLPAEKNGLNLSVVVSWDQEKNKLRLDLQKYPQEKALFSKEVHGSLPQKSRLLAPRPRRLGSFAGVRAKEKTQETTVAPVTEGTLCQIVLGKNSTDTFLVVGDMKIYMWREAELLKGRNPVNLGRVRCVLGEKTYFIACKELVEAIERFSEKNVSVCKKDLESRLESVLGVKKRAINTPPFPQKNPVLQTKLQQMVMTNDEAANTIRYVHSYLDEFVEQLAWVDPLFPMIKVKKCVGLPCSLILHFVDDRMIIDFFAKRVLGRGADCEVQEFVRLDDGNMQIMARRGIRKKDERGIRRQASELAALGGILAEEETFSKRLIQQKVPFIGKDDLRMVPSHKGSVEKVYTERAQKDFFDMIAQDQTILALPGLWDVGKAIEMFSVLLCIFDGVKSMHACSVCHFDLKPANILVLEDGSPRIIDFGMAHVANAHDVLPGLTLQGTRGYLEPGRYLGNDFNNPQTVDIFALGVMLMEIFLPMIVPGHSFLESQIIEFHADKSPKTNDDHYRETCAEIDQYQRTIRSQFKEENAGKLYYAIAAMIDIDPKNRPTAEQVFAILLEVAPEASKKLYEKYRREYFA